MIILRTIQVAILLYILSITCRVVFIVDLYRENRGNEKSEIFIAISFAKKGGNNAKSYIVYDNKRVFLFLFIFRNIVGH
ncbi:hypothetical protein B9L19_16580 [Geobacillus thermocatenulatus]|uniref:Uncharacterized protein n=1 Tax=Geobacillus thermocatenulatus TaxID=33938 RepID=A0AA91QLL7_9BACL|nr:hypothetical protein ABH20_02130 [Geobacillus sp. T6]OXB87046.1 hypothetical protein B9L19_16580 [Geobacillus thermocatenulatus]